MQHSVLVGIFFKLLSRRKTTAAELAERYEVSARTVYRYLEILDAAGLPITTERGFGGGISISDDFRIEKSFFTRAEYEYLIRSLENLAKLEPEGEAYSIFNKITALSKFSSDDTQYLINTRSLIIDGGGWTEHPALRGKITAINKAIADNTLIKLVYYDAELKGTERLAEPYAFILKEGGWYLYAYCRLREDYRTFRLSRIKSVNVTQETFSRRSNVPAPPEEISKKSIISLKIEFKEEIRMEIEDWLGIDSVYGNAAAAEVNDSRALTAKLLSFGSAVKVISPVKTAKEVQKAAAAIMEGYSVF